jgi:ABC-2 type transport system ATP-binding protein
MTYAIETNQLSKHYGPVWAVREINLRVKQGEVYGFVGLNGAGKTTTIRMVLGMIRPSAGTVSVLGQAIGSGGRDGPWGRVGHMVEAPAAYPELTVLENLEIARRLQGLQNSKAVDEVIDRLQLSLYANRKAGTLSSGNFQRLGLARALLHSPALLILDEPGNALDPAGIVEIRELLESLAREKGVTVFMSSHILTEVDRLADRIGIIHKGQLIEELDAARLEEIRGRQLVIEARDLVKARGALADFEVVGLGDKRLGVRDKRAVERPEMIATMLVNAGTPPTHLALEQENLEAYFLRLTQ